MIRQEDSKVFGIVSKETLLFCIAIVALFFWFNFDSYLFLRPQSLHIWRQTDSLAFISGYLKNDGGLFSPSVLNLQCGDGHTAAEFPLVYWLISKVSFLSENAEVSLKTIYLFTHFVGLWFAYRLFTLSGLHYLFGMAFILLVGSSAVLNYYACNYVPDAFAFGLTLIGLFCAFKGSASGRLIFKVVAVTVFTFASLSKIQFLIYPLSFLGAQLLGLLSKTQRDERPVFRLNADWMYLIPVVIAFIWFSYVKIYNEHFCSTCFLTSIKPIWDLNGDQIADVWDHISRYWWTAYYYETTFHVLYVVIVMVFILMKWIDRQLRLTLIMATLGCISFFLLFYSQFMYHDYYAICMMPLLVLLIAALGNGLSNFTGSLSKYLNVAGILAVWIVALLSVNYGKTKLERRYVDGVKKGSIGTDFYTVDTDSLEIPQDALVMSFPDNTCNGTLYFLDRRGFTVSESDLSPELLREMSKRGANFMIVDRSRTDIDVLKLLGHGWIETANYGSLSVFSTR